jgi:hypothetical protein
MWGRKKKELIQDVADLRCEVHKLERELYLFKRGYAIVPDKVVMMLDGIPSVSYGSYIPFHDAIDAVIKHLGVEFKKTPAVDSKITLSKVDEKG